MAKRLSPEPICSYFKKDRASICNDPGQGIGRAISKNKKRMQQCRGRYISNWRLAALQRAKQEKMIWYVTRYGEEKKPPVGFYRVLHG